jgi:hypothetical protein
MGRDALSVIRGMCDLDKQTLLGAYEPFGAHATIIYEFLRSNGLITITGHLTEFGFEVKRELENDPYFRVDKPCDTE